MIRYCMGFCRSLHVTMWFWDKCFKFVWTSVEGACIYKSLPVVITWLPWIVSYKSLRYSRMVLLLKAIFCLMRVKYLPPPFCFSCHGWWWWWILSPWSYWVSFPYAILSEKVWKIILQNYLLGRDSRCLANEMSIYDVLKW